MTMISCAGPDSHANLPGTLGTKHEGANPAPHIQTAAALITEARKRPAQATGGAAALLEWKAAVFAGLPQDEQVRYLCHVLGQPTLNADESVHVSRVVSIYRQQHGDSPRAALEGLSADVRKDMISRNPKGDERSLGYNYWVFNL